MKTCAQSIWHPDKCYPKSKQLCGRSKARVKDLDEHRMVQGTHHIAGQISNLFLPATKSLLAERLLKERSALREGKPLTTDFHFPKNIKTW